ncbi:MAG: hypothetical protein IJ046_02050, partial [Clostridia bacterium]|nr:hypothetical protein [Clostridia bacterium]
MAQQNTNKNNQKKPSQQNGQKKKPSRYSVKKVSAAEKKRIEEQMKIEEQKREERRALWAQTVPYLLIISAILLVIIFFTGRGEDPGAVSGFIYNVLTGLFSISAIVIPVFLVFAGVCEFLDKSDSIIGMRTVSALVSAVLFAVLFELISPADGYNIKEMFVDGTSLSGGGVIGGIIGQTFLFCFKSAGSFVIVVGLLILGVLLTIGITPKYLFLYLKMKFDEWQVRREEEKALRAEVAEAADEEEWVEPDPEPAVPERIPAIPSVRKRKGAKFDTDVPVDDDDALPEEAPAPEACETPEERMARLEREKYEDVMAAARKNKTPEEMDAENAVFGGDSEWIPPVDPVQDDSDEDLGADIIDKLADTFLGDDEEGEGDGGIAAERGPVSGVVGTQMKIDIPKPEYRYPPIELLGGGAPTAKAQNVREELHDNAAKLVSVLASFNVRTKIVGVSRGPTITRYELLPEPGTRVKSIANLVDDIALNLATSGVRIEAPIPGKAAVGIEVPNKVAETVYLRALIEDRAFADHKSKIASCLGKDVAGTSVIMDIAKMPHLLIAGATGMGKSVCINSILVSLLYRATPDDMKLILIDPKKVEFSIYNGRPPLLVPVVSDPKKAAGSLQWAVNEMERRFGLIESVGVRDIDGFNKITENDP